MKNTSHIGLDDRKIINARFIQVSQLPQIDSYLTAKLYVDDSIDERLLVRNNQDNDFNNYNLTDINSNTLNTPAVNDNHVSVDQFHQENERSRRDLVLDFYNESNDLMQTNQGNDLNEKKLTNLDGVSGQRNHISNIESANKKYVDQSLGSSNILIFNQTLQNYLKVSVGNDLYYPSKYDKLQITDTREFKFPNIGRDFFQKWNNKSKDKNNDSKVGNFVKSTITNSPISYSGATSLPPIGSAFIYIETSSNNLGH